MHPTNLVNPRVGLDVTFKIHVGGFSNHGGVQAAAQLEGHEGDICRIEQC